MAKGREENSTIQVYARIRPDRRKSSKKRFHILEGDQQDRLELLLNDVTKSNAKGREGDPQPGEIANNKKDVYDYSFTGVFDPEAEQDSVYEQAAAPVVESTLRGFNGTVFAYGATGSGKTFTITGGTQRYAQRGIIPRALAHIFDHANQVSSDITYSISVSYLEIYNGKGYDLLANPNTNSSVANSRLDQLPQVVMMEDGDGRLHMQNLSIVSTASIEDALNLLFVGDTNRVICETPMNDASSRSHCIFTVQLEARRNSQAATTVRTSKLNLVDLAGSERVYKTRIDGTILREAQEINISLHFLEQVIVALHEQHPHIPYRNSLLTSVLKDSLGGNCKTVMIANLSVESQLLDESISTCRFAQRVACIKNTPTLNESHDPQLMIKALRARVRQLEQQLERAKRGENVDDEEDGSMELTQNDCQELQVKIDEFLREDDESTEALVLLPVGQSTFVRYCYGILKRHVRQATYSALPSTDDVERRRADLSGDTPHNISELKEQLKSRDNEIEILVDMLKEKEITERSKREQKMSEKSFKPVMTPHANPRPAVARPVVQGEQQPAEPVGLIEPEKALERQEKRQSMIEKKASQGKISKRETEMLLQRNAAFEEFRTTYSKREAIEQHQESMKVKFSRAKELGQRVNQVRNEINALKAALQQVRVERSVREAVQGEAKPIGRDEQRLMTQLEQKKHSYRETFTQLRDLKAEIEHIQLLLRQSRIRLQKEFEEWWNQKRTQEQKQQTIAEEEKLDQNSVPSTGDPSTDADVVAFMRLRDKLFKQT